VLPYFLYIGVNTGVIYPLVVRYFWANEFRLYEDGKEYHDFAGASVVHLLAGACAFAAVTIVGPRHKAHPAHSLVFMYVGVMLLLFGWLGFNGGSVAKADFMDLTMKPIFGRICTNTILGGSSGVVVAFVWRSLVPQLVWIIYGSYDPDRKKVKEWLRWWREECQPDWNSPQQPPGITVDSHPRTDFFGSLNGLVSGLVAVTGFCNVAHRREAIALGALGATAYCISSHCLTQTHAYREVLGSGNWWPWNWRCFARCRITFRHRRGERGDTAFWFDDVIDAIPAHYFGGLVGVCAYPILRGDWEQLLVQTCGALVISVIGFVGTSLVLFPMRCWQDHDVWRRLRQGPVDPTDEAWSERMEDLTVGFVVSVSAQEEQGSLDIFEFGLQALEYLCAPRRDGQDSDQPQPPSDGDDTTPPPQAFGRLGPSEVDRPTPTF